MDARNIKFQNQLWKTYLKQKDSHTGCFATDRIIVDGAEIRFIYREMPLDNQDSGWRFMAGDEDDEYMNDTSKSGIYHLNTLCNYEPSILKFLDEPYGSMFIKNKNGEFVKFER